MTTRCVVVGLSLITSVGCDQIDPVTAPDFTPPAAPISDARPLRLVDLPGPLRWDLAEVRGQRDLSALAVDEAVPAAYALPPEINDWFVAVGWNGTSTLDGYAFMTFYGNWAQQELELQIYRNGALLGQRSWTETGSSIWPKQSGALTTGALSVSVSCGASGNGSSKHAAEVRLLTGQTWTTLGRNNKTDADVAIQAACPPPPTCELKPQSFVSSSARMRAQPSAQLTASDFEQCADPPPPGGDGSDETDSGGYVCYEVWLVYPDTGVEIYLGDVCYEEYAT